MWPFKRKKKIKRDGSVDDIVRHYSEQARTGKNDPYNFQPPWEVDKKWKRAREVQDQHFRLMEAMQSAYKERAKHGTDNAVRLCEKMIDLAPSAMQAFRDDHEFIHEDRRKNGSRSKKPSFRAPSHPGFKQLAIIREKEGQFTEAISLSKQAQKQGWAGDWDTRIARLEGKRAKR